MTSSNSAPRESSSRRLRAIGRSELASPDRKRTYNEELFEQVAPRYRLATRFLSFGRDPRWKRVLVATALERHYRSGRAARRLSAARGLQPAPVSIDLACGTGDVTFELARQAPDGSVTGVDVSIDMVRRARLAQAREKIANASFAIGDMATLPASDATVDVVTGSYALRNASDLEATLCEVFRVLRPGGIAAFLEFSLPTSRLRRALQLRLLRVWGQLWGVVLHGNPEIYAYIARSLSRFPDSTEFVALLRRIGFADHRSRDLMGGFVRITIVDKPR